MPPPTIRSPATTCLICRTDYSLNQKIIYLPCYCKTADARGCGVACLDCGWDSPLTTGRAGRPSEKFLLTRTCPYKKCKNMEVFYIMEVSEVCS